LLSGNYPHLELIAIDDRSTDGTGEIMDRLAAEDERLNVVHVSELPEGWLGKNHAMQSGAAAARGEFILFTDGDILFGPETLKDSIRVMLHDRLDHLTLYPQMILYSPGESALAAFFGFMFLLGTSSWNVSTGNRRSYAGIGAFNLVRAEPYRQVGGHEPLRLEVLDDVRLGQLLKDRGYQSQLLIGGESVRVRWQSSLWQMIRGLEKNAYASVGYSLPYLIFALSIMGILVYAPFIGIVLFPDSRSIPYWGTLVLMHAGFAECNRRIQGDSRSWPLLTIGAATFMFAYARSCWITLAQNGVRWRDTFYPLDQLRKQQYLHTRRFD
ncbi:MAG: glycosyltransferase, partial [Planctomycetaceae bacterium]|nr:glycosyltransferase [Planctomycetaceae bacterium]